MGPTLETPRLILRPPREEDLDGWEELLGDEEVARFIGGVRARPEAWRAMMTMAGSWALKGFAMFSVIAVSSLIALGLAITMLCLEMQKYNWDFKANEVQLRGSLDQRDAVAVAVAWQPSQLPYRS